MLTDTVERPLTRQEQLIHASATSLLFMLVYGGTSWFTSLRAPVPTLYFSWEQWIPFLPWMVIPYMSIDVFFFLAPFLHRSRADLCLFSRRISTVIVIAGVCFLLFPLQLAVTRPVASGWTGAIYNWFCTVDRPYNLCPSLHIALRVLLADVYARHTAGLVRIGQHVWFSLIGISTLTLYQHHVVDIVGGVILGIGCLYALRPQPWRLPFTTNPAVGGKYLLLFSVLLLMSSLLWPEGILLLWPTVSVGLIASAYFFFGPAVFRKSGGVIPPSSRLIMGPVILGQWISLKYYSRQCDVWNPVTERVWIGRVPDEQSAAAVVESGVTAVLDLTAEFSAPAPFRNTDYRNIQVLDLTAPTQQQLQEAVEFIQSRQVSGIVYVHCKIGYSRSAAVTCAWLLRSGKANSVEESIRILKSVRPSIIIRPEILRALQEFSLSTRSISPPPTL